MARASNEPVREFYDPNDFTSQVREYARLKETIDSLDKRSKELRDQLMKVLDEDGLEDDKGNVLYDLDEPIDGIIRIEKQRRATRKLDELKAEEIIEARGISDKVYKMVRVIDEDALMAAHYDGDITEEEIDEMFPVTVVWALRTPKK
jgi:predicted  nucleic acid-binding Zn-ribbon protein